MSSKNERDPKLAALDFNRNSLGRGFTPPAPEHYNHAIFLWDTGFIAWRYAAGNDPDTATTELEKLLSTQDKETGFIPNMTFLGKGRISDLERILVFGPTAKSSDYSQPPVLAMTASKIHETFTAQDRPAEAQDFLARNYDSLALFYRNLAQPEQRAEDGKSWLIKIADPSGSGRDSDHIFDDDKLVRIPMTRVPKPIEPAVRRINGGLDYGSHLWIGVKRRLGRSDFSVTDVMHNCIYAENLRYMADLAQNLNKYEDAEEFSQRAERVEEEVLGKLWDNQDGAFYARRKGKEGESSVKKVSVGSLFPLILDSTEPNQVDKIMQMLESPEWFSTPYPVPSIPANSPNYDPDYKEPRIWRGPVWINMNWYITRGLQKQAERFKDLDSAISERANSLAWHIGRKTKELVEKSGYREFYNPETGAGLRDKVKNFAWSTLADTL